MSRTTLAPPGRARSVVLSLGAGLLLALVAGPAYAHDELTSSNPADGATLATPPSQVVLTFEEPPVELGAQVVVTGPDGPVSTGSPRLTGDDVVVDVQPSAPAGRYTVEWRVTSDDGHPVSGSFGFTAQAAAGGTPSAVASPAAEPTPAPAVPPRREPLIPSWAWIIGGVIVIVAAIRINRQARANTKED